MLREILLSLSGVRSAVWEDLSNYKDGAQHSDVSLGSLSSPAEREMLKTLAELADLHIRLREATIVISKSHLSSIGRAVSNQIRSKHLRAFNDKVVEVETSILRKDAGYVGAYRIVPLSTIVTEFQSWSRPMKWLWKIVQKLQPGISSSDSCSCSAAKILDLLQIELHTGYSDIRRISGDLLVVAEQAWVHSLAPWILYGRLPSFGVEDFMIARSSSTNQHGYVLREELVPYFVTPEAAENTLAIGKALNQVKSRRLFASATPTSTNICTALMPSTLDKIESLEYPLQNKSFADAVDAVNSAISQIALTQLLPMDVIHEFLLVMQDYILLGNGEFSTSLINQADIKTASHLASTSIGAPTRRLGKLDRMTITEGVVAAILAETWSELSAILPSIDSREALLNKASSWLRLRMPTDAIPISTLLPTTTCLVIELPSDSPLHIFISASDIKRYRDLSAYLISINRAVAQLVKLWKIPIHRRCYPTPIRPSPSITTQGRQSLQARRTREDRRNHKMRTHWACVSQVLFLLSETGNYFHGEIIQKSWSNLREWLHIDDPARVVSSKESTWPNTAISNRSTMHTSTSANGSLRRNVGSVAVRRDPRTIAQAHQKYLETLYNSLLLNNTSYVSTLKDVLTTLDHFVALFQRLQLVWQTLDFQADEGTMDAFTDHAKEENELMAEMNKTNSDLIDLLHELVDVLREAEKSRGSEDMSAGVARINLSGFGKDEFEPWRPRTLNQLLMKLDFMVVNNKNDTFEDALVDVGED